MAVGRNEPCPCGSGRKYKKCCGAAESAGAPEQPVSANMEYFALHQAIAYKGKIGEARANFCREYIASKQTALNEIELDQLEKTAARLETITCRKGCANCCTQYILGTLQECEAIVYYLYQHEDILADFMLAYPVWRNRVKQYDVAFKAVKDAVARQIREGVTEANTQAYDEANVRFLKLNIQCPFQNKEGACSIHEVRPWNCAKPVVTTPSEWCHPSTNLKNDKPSAYVSHLVPEEMPFYRRTKSLNVLLVHLGVYEILTGGYAWLSGISGLEGLEKEALNDPEVKAILSEYL